MTRNQLPPTIAELTAAVLARAESAEVAVAAEDAYGDVQPHEVAIGLRPDPRTAWNAAMEAHTSGKMCPPTDWGTLVARHESVAALPFAIGNYPQRVRDLASLFQQADLSQLVPSQSESTDAPAGLASWATRLDENGDDSARLVAAGALRAAGDLENARLMLGKVSTSHVARENEVAALLWHQGDHVAAAKMWQELPDSVPVKFNRGMAMLFLGQVKDAIGQLESAAQGLHDSSPWHHLANLYRTMAAARSSN